MSQSDEDTAFDLLRTIVDRARDGLSYKAQLVELGKLLKNAPQIRAGIIAACRKHYG